MERADGERVFLTLLGAFVAWVGVEAARPGAATRALPELERDVLYLATAWAALQLVRRRTVGAALTGVLAASCALLLDGLARLLVPAHIGADLFEGRLLFRPLGYANACGVLAALGLVLALGLSHRLAGRSRSAAAAVLVPLAVSLALTGSRGAALALAVGLAVAAALHPARRTFAGTALVLLPLPAAAAALAAQSHVADAGASTTLIAHDCVVVAAATCAATLAQAALAARAHVRLTLPAAAVASIAVALVAAAATAAALSRGDRAAYWQLAWQDARAHPLLGSGPGTFAREWLAHRPDATGALNAHNLYLETLAEVGPFGLLLLVAALALPLAAAWRRRSPLAAVAAGGYATFLAHAAIDWDWQMPAVTVAGILCAVCAVRAGSAGVPSRRGPIPGLALAAALALASAAAGVGNDALAGSARAAQAGAWDDAARSARLASAWQPWSAEPRRLLAEIALAEGDPAGARRFLVQALRRDPADVSAWSDLVRAGTPAQRRQALERLRRLSSGRAGAARSP